MTERLVCSSVLCWNGTIRPDCRRTAHRHAGIHGIASLRMDSKICVLYYRPSGFWDALIAIKTSSQRPRSLKMWPGCGLRSRSSSSYTCPTPNFAPRIFIQI